MFTFCFVSPGILNKTYFSIHSGERNFMKGLLPSEEQKITYVKTIRSVTVLSRAGLSFNSLSSLRHDFTVVEVRES
jgi:hypothetical protein